MTMTSYPNGYGRRDPVPQCIEHLYEIECPCCQGAMEHYFGAGMDADGVTCSYCGGYGVMRLERIRNTRRN